jgi:predicted ATPase
VATAFLRVIFFLSLARLNDRSVPSFRRDVSIDRLRRHGRSGSWSCKNALAGAEENSEHVWVPELLCLKGQLLLSRSAQDAGGAESCFQRALDAARGLDARLLELRAATLLARLWAERGERPRAHDLLGPIYGWFTEGFDTPDLKGAKLLLDALN